MGIGAACNVLGYLGLWAAASGHVELAYWQVVAIAVLACNGGAWVDTACLVTSTRNFPGERGTIIGILKSCMGLSASIWTALYVGLFQPRAIDFLLFLAFAPAALTLVGIFFVNAVPFVQVKEGIVSRRLMFAIQVLLTLGVYQAVTAIMEQSKSLALGPRARQAITAGTLLLVAAISLVPWGTGGLWAVPVSEDDLAAANPADGQDTEAAPAPAERDASAEGEAARPLLPGAPDGHADSAHAGVKAAAPEPDLTPWQCLASVDFWLLFFTCTIGMGSGLVLLNNLGQLVAALGGTQGPAVYVSLFSIMNCAGRIAFGYIPERMLHERGTPRPLFLVGAGLGTAAVAALAAFVDLAALYPVTVLAGAAFGAHWSLMPALMSEIFGLHHFASNYCLVQFAPAVGSYAMATKLAGFLYDQQARSEGGALSCVGRRCYRSTFMCTAALNLASTFCAWRLLRRRVLAQRARKGPPTAAPGRPADALEGAPGSLARVSGRASALRGSLGGPRRSVGTPVEVALTAVRRPHIP